MNMKRIGNFIFSFALIFAILTIVFVCAAYQKKKTESEFSFTIGDTLPDGEGKEAVVILLGGQSNASGCSRDDYLKENADAEKYAEYERGYDNVYINYYATGTNESRGFVKCSVRQGEAGGHFGPELGLAERLSERRPDETFFIIKCAWGGTNLFEQWLSPATLNVTGPLYRGFVQYVNQSLDFLISKNYSIKIEGMCWMQGESDSFSEKNGTDYKRHLSNFIKDIRAEFSEYAAEDGIAFIDAEIADNPVYWVFCDLVNESKRAVSELSPMNVLIDTNAEGLTCDTEPVENPDRAHYDSMSQIKLGHLFAESLLPFLN